jgi:hemerythrin
MKWSDEYSVGIEEIDQQHKVLLEMFGAVEHSIESAGTWSDVHYGLLKLKEFANRHFLLEQALMRMFGYPELAGHITTHQYFFEKLNELEHRSLGVTTRTETIEFLGDWFKNHICETDRQYADYILSDGKIIRSKKPTCNPQPCGH